MKRLRAWIIRNLGGHVDPVGPRELYLRHEQPSFLPLDRPFDPIDWERLATLPNREAVFFEWMAHRIRYLEKEARACKVGLEGDRHREVYLARIDENMRTFEVAREAAEKLVLLLQQKEKAGRLQAVEKGLNNHGG